MNVYDQLALAMMKTRPDLKELSLDEWLLTHMDALTRRERQAAQAIINLHIEKA